METPTFGTLALIPTQSGFSPPLHPDFPLALLCDQHLVLTFTKGGGVLQLDGMPLEWQQGDSLIVSPGSALRLDNQPPVDSACRWAFFHAFRVGRSEPERAVTPFLPYGQLIAALPLAQAIDSYEQLAEALGVQGELAKLKQQICLQQLLVFLLEQHRSSQASTDAAQAVERTVHYMKTHFREALSVDQLCRMAGVGRSQYSSLFQQLTGQKPLAFLTELRLKRARELLLQTNDPLREIARAVGFADEYYFNRRFSQHMGISPKQYVRLHQQQAASSPPDWTLPIPQQPRRVVAIGYTLGDMLALGLRPIAADLGVIRNQVLFADELAAITDVSVSDQFAQLAALQPDLILHCGHQDGWHDAFKRIAPTLTIDHAEDTFDRLRLVADISGKKRQADSWISRFETNVAHMWSQFQASITPGETATVLLQLGDELFVMGNKGLGVTVYHPLAFRPPAAVSDMIANRERFRAIEPAELPVYAGDRLFFLINHSSLSRQYAQQLMQSPVWTTLAAVQQQHVYLADATWNFDDPITRERLLGIFPRIFTKTS